jgi:DNA primase
LEEAGKDPIKRAELIGDIVRSISVIPEPIVRSVYVKECSQLLHVEEKLLVSEIAKQTRKLTEKENKPVTDTPLYPTLQDISEKKLPSEPEAPITDYDSFIPQESKEEQEFYKYEQLIIQVVVRHGEKTICYAENEVGEEVPVNVIEYIVNDLKQDELHFHNPLHRRILAEAADQIHSSGFVAERYFITHSDPEISKLATNLANDKYQLSKNQKMRSDEERLHELVPTFMGNFKDAIVNEELKHIMYALQDPETAHNLERCNAMQRRYKELKKIHDLMSKRLGDRVVLSN